MILKLTIFMNNYKFQTMRRFIIVILIMPLIPFMRIAAQNPNLEKLNDYKIAFFTRRMSFSSSEAEKFWPVYNQYQDKKNKILVERNSIIKDYNKNGNSLSDKQLTELGDKLVSTIAEESSLAVTFHQQLKKILTPAKVIKFYQVENQYKIQLLNELQGSRPQQRLTPGRDF